MTTAHEEFVPLYYRWMEAIQRNDLEALDGILGEEYIYTASGQGRHSREDWMNTLKMYDIHQFDFLSIEIHDYGDMVVAFPHYHQEASVNGSQRSGDFLITDVWVKRDGRWQVVARSSILMPQ